MTVFILQTYNASWDQFTSSCMKTGEKRIIRPDELNRLVCLHRRTKRFSSSRRTMRLSPVLIQDEGNWSEDALYVCSIKTANKWNRVSSLPVASKIFPEFQRAASIRYVTKRVYSCTYRRLVSWGWAGRWQWMSYWWGLVALWSHPQPRGTWIPQSAHRTEEWCRSQKTRLKYLTCTVHLQYQGNLAWEQRR